MAPTEESVTEYYRGIELAAEAGYEAVNLHHGWINGKLTSPIFTNYGDYQLRPELFPNGWSDVKKLTDYAHSLGVVCISIRVMLVSGTVRRARW